MASVIIVSIDLHNITNRESFSGLLWSNMPNITTKSYKCKATYHEK